MIKDGMVYECVDERAGVVDRLNGFAMLTPVPDGFEVRTYTNLLERFLFEEDDQLEEVNTVSTFRMPEGQVHFMELTLPDFERLGGPAKYRTPKFKDTAQMQQFFRERIENL